jgi:hypothetical protein
VKEPEGIDPDDLPTQPMDKITAADMDVINARIKELDDQEKRDRKRGK